MKLYIRKVVAFEVFDEHGYPQAVFSTRRDARRWKRRWRKLYADS